MRKVVFAIAIVLAVAGATVFAGSLINSEPAVAGCSSRC
jgi:hypothetical protein